MIIAETFGLKKRATNKIVVVGLSIEDLKFNIDEIKESLATGLYDYIKFIVSEKGTQKEVCTEKYIVVL